MDSTEAEEAAWMEQHNGITLGHASWPHVGKCKGNVPEEAKQEQRGPIPVVPISNQAQAVPPKKEVPPLPPSLVGVRVASAKLSERELRRLGYGPEDEEEEEDVTQPPVILGEWPVVEFKDGQKVLLPPMEFKVEDTNGKLEAQRSQVPLILAWALSIHKSQGQTLERVKIDMGDIFECGQAYVALSRATQLVRRQSCNGCSADTDMICSYFCRILCKSCVFILTSM